jgi:hypothetical protein
MAKSTKMKEMKKKTTMKIPIQSDFIIMIMIMRKVKIMMKIYLTMKSLKPFKSLDRAIGACNKSSKTI